MRLGETGDGRNEAVLHGADELVDDSEVARSVRDLRQRVRLVCRTETDLERRRLARFFVVLPDRLARTNLAALLAPLDGCQSLLGSLLGGKRLG